MKRFWEIDSLRGIAIILMVISNFITDIIYFKIYEPGALGTFWTLLAYATATAFITLVGISLTLSGAQTKGSVWKTNLKRGLMILSWGLIITAVTYRFMESGYIVFGVLHFIGVAVMIAAPFLKYEKLNLWLGLALIALGSIIRSFAVDSSWLLWIGLTPNGFYSVDYFPLIPWFGIVLIGIFLGNRFYPNGKRILPIGENESRTAKILSYLGRNSLKIYLIHQPILIGLILLICPAASI